MPPAVGRVGAIRRPHLDGLDTAILVAGVALVAYVVVDLPLADDAGHIVAPTLDLVLDTVALVVVFVAATLAWVRYRWRGETIALYEAAAFLALTVAAVSAVAVTLLDGALPTSGLIVPAQRQLEVFAGARIIAGATLVVGGWRALGGRGTGPVAIALLLPSVLAAAIAASTAVGAAIPFSVPTTPLDSSLDLVTMPPGFAAEIAAAILAMVAAILCRALARRDGSVGDRYLAFGLVLASFAQLHEAFHPSVHPVDVGASDVLWLGFGISLLLGIEAEAMATVRAMQRTNRQLDDLRSVEVERAALEERARLARELHDGLTQDLWLAKIKVANLAAAPGPDPETARLSEVAIAAVDASLADARKAVAALRGDRSAAETEAPLCTVVGRVVDEFGDRYGIRAEISCHSIPAGLHYRTSAEVVGVIEEALSNAGRHADPTLVRVEVQAASDILHVTVQDNGRGFDPGAVPLGEFGIAGMRERAALVGGELTFDSRPLDGTRVTLRVPLRSTAVDGRGDGR